MPQQSAQITIGDGLVRINATVTKTVTGNVSIEEVVANSTTNGLIACAFPATGLKMFAICSDKDVTVKTNSSGSPQETWALKANQPKYWCENDPGSAPVAGAVTALYVTNSSGADATIKLIAGYDA